jgi:hypothetical protein
MSSIQSLKNSGQASGQRGSQQPPLQVTTPVLSIVQIQQIIERMPAASL